MRSRILQAAVAAIDTGGTESLRVVTVAQEAGASQGMIRYYFGSREGLVEEALAQRFSSRFGEMLSLFEAEVEKCSSQEELRIATERVLDYVYSSDRSRLRLERNREIGTASDHPALAARIAANRDEVCRQLAGAISAAQQRGLVRADADPLSVATLHLSLVHGLSLWELGDTSIDADLVKSVLRASLFASMFE